MTVWGRPCCIYVSTGLREKRDDEPGTCVAYLQHHIAVASDAGVKGTLMNLEKFTDRAKGFLQSAQTVAIRMSHQRISPEHILKALLEDEQGMAAGLITAAGGDPKRAATETDAALAKVPAVSGGGARRFGSMGAERPAQSRAGQQAGGQMAH